MGSNNQNIYDSRDPLTLVDNNEFEEYQAAHKSSEQWRWFIGDRKASSSRNRRREHKQRFHIMHPSAMCFNFGPDETRK